MQSDCKAEGTKIFLDVRRTGRQDLKQIGFGDFIDKDTQITGRN